MKICLKGIKIFGWSFFISEECRADDDCPFDKACTNGNCINPCFNAFITCGRGAECTAIAHKAQCNCPAGTQGDARTACIIAVCHYNEDCAEDETCDRLNRVCRKVCSEDSCGDEALCTAKNHEPMCSCPPGTKGNPYVECEGKNQLLYSSIFNIFLQILIFCKFIISFYFSGEQFKPDCTEDRQCSPNFACINARCQDPCLVANMCSDEQICRVFPTEYIRTIICECPKDSYTDENGNCIKHGKKLIFFKFELKF